MATSRPAADGSIESMFEPITTEFKRSVLALNQRERLVTSLIHQARTIHGHPDDTPEQVDARVAEALGWFTRSGILRRKHPDAKRVLALFKRRRDPRFREVQQLAAAAECILEILVVPADDAAINLRYQTTLP